MGDIMAFDYKKEYKEFYLPKNRPAIVEVPRMKYVAVRGRGNPNDEAGEYKAAIGVLYALAYTIKMSGRGGHEIAGFFDFVVPPLEGFWWQDGAETFDANNKDGLRFISVIRLPDFVTTAEFEWARSEAQRKKGADFSCAELLEIDEGLCVQCMHVGPYDSEPETVRMMHDFAAQNGLVPDLSAERLHHEIYLSDPRKCAASRLRTVVRHPVRKAEG